MTKKQVKSALRTVIRGGNAPTEDSSDEEKSKKKKKDKKASRVVKPIQDNTISSSTEKFRKNMKNNSLKICVFLKVSSLTRKILNSSSL